MIFGIISVAVVMVFLIAFCFYSSNTGSEDFNTGVLIGMFIIIFAVAEIIMIFCISNEPRPMAIDVYRNKTELEITSVNGVPRDTVVVWKGGI